MNPRRFASHGSDAFNDWMEQQVAAIGETVRLALGDNLVLLALSGGYARGEGGVLLRDGRELPYNDLDFILVVRERHAEMDAALAEISRKFGDILGIDVDFSRPLTPADVAQWPHWLMWTDVYRTHRTIVGDPQFITRTAPADLNQSPPLIEATRLLLNRGAGLLWSLRIARGLEAPHDPDFLRRNLHKAEIAIGDAVILAHGRHHAPYTGRLEILGELLATDDLARQFADSQRYEAALQFRLTPGAPEEQQPSEADLMAIGRRWVAAFLYLEGRRTGRSFADSTVYARWDAMREPELHTLPQRLKNLLRNAKLGSFSLSYPREGLYRKLPLLLAEQSKVWPEQSAAFLRVWRRYN